MLTVDAAPYIEVMVKLHEAPLIEGTDKMVHIDDNLSLMEMNQLMVLLRRWSRIFTWDVDELLGISPTIIQHLLNIEAGSKLV